MVDRFVRDVGEKGDRILFEWLALRSWPEALWAWLRGQP